MLDESDPDCKKMKAIVDEYADEEAEHVSVQKLKHTALGLLKYEDLNESEKMAYEIYNIGFRDGGDAAQMAAFNRILDKFKDKPEEEWTTEEKALVEKFNFISDMFIGTIVSSGLGNTEITVCTEDDDDGDDIS